MNLSYRGILHYNSSGGLWLSVDPLADNYPFLSPYVYGACSPVVLVDADGRDLWIVDEYGNLLDRQKKGYENYDVFKIVRSNEQGQEELATLNLNKRIILTYEVTNLKYQYQGETKEVKLTLWLVKGGKECEQLFKFLSENITSQTWIEFGLMKVGDKSDDARQRGFVFTSHTYQELWGNEYVYKYVNPKEFIEHTHSHYDNPFPSEEDIDAKIRIFELQNENGGKMPDFFIYYTRNKRKIPY